MKKGLSLSLESGFDASGKTPVAIYVRLMVLAKSKYEPWFVFAVLDYLEGIQVISSDIF